MSFLDKIFGDPNEKYIKKLQLTVEGINALEVELKSLKDEDFPKKTAEFKSRLESGEAMDDILPEAFAVAREASRRVLGQRHYDSQVIGGIVLHQGKIAEMKTGEGKTLTATLPIYLNALSGKGVHVVTVNDYLARRDLVWMGQIYNFLGLSSACINHMQSFVYDANFSAEGSDEDIKRDELGGFKVVENYLRPSTRKEAYDADITYGTNNEFGFDYLKDNMVYDLSAKSQREFNFAIIDEVDSILIDEARTPLIISAPDSDSSDMYQSFSRIVPRLQPGKHYEVFEKEKTVTVTEEGVAELENILGVENIYEEKGIKYLHHLEQALRAQALNPTTKRPLFEKDHHYIVKDDQIIIIDESTGRQMPGRRWSGGLHQAIEAKEGVFVQPESKTLASITFQNYFRMYGKLSGMTGTALTSAEEFDKVYKLEVIAVPTNKPMIRRDLPDLVYRTTMGKYQAIVREIKERHEKGQPVLVGTTSIEKNEFLGKLLEREGVSHRILNAKNHEKEAEIIAQAGRFGAVTVATNMAGRGVDIILGGNPPEDAEKVINSGGLHIIGTERHEARRIDDQLRGRAGRQGDPGSSQFFLSLEDDLLRVFGADRIESLAGYLHMPEDQPIETKMLSGIIESAQGKIEGFHFDARKYLLDYDDVANKQREVIYKKRLEVLKKWKEGTLRDIMLSLIGDYGYTEEDYQKKESDIGLENMKSLEKVVCLRVLDSLWVDHLENLQSLRESVRLRAYGQKDPLIEYKNEARRMFQELINTWEKEVVEMMFKVKSVSFAPSPIEKGGMEMRQQSRVPVSKKSDKVGRNDPCPCGAKHKDGRPKKYKQCCGA
ncbi:MAG: preprotein translocase subunit SecA [Candidatus Pacebacteria bacterium]|nr:preprotein translocase subunit SecA [Candidatus Paceibacterota bacterium]